MIYSHYKISDVDSARVQRVMTHCVLIWKVHLHVFDTPGDESVLGHWHGLLHIEDDGL